MTSITDRTIAKLWGLAAGRCSICKIELVEQDVKIGEMAHIIAKSKIGPRGHLEFDGDLNSYENLILLCPNHHSEVDDNPSAYPVEKLRTIKQEHEAHVRNLFSLNSQARNMDVAGLSALMRYLPFTLLPTLTQGLPERFNHRLFYVSETFDNFALDNPQCRPFSDQNLESYYSKFCHVIEKIIDYEQHATISDKLVYVPGSLMNADANTSYLNRSLTSDERRQATRTIQQLLEELAEAYFPFMRFLKANYSEINLASFDWRN